MAPVFDDEARSLVLACAFDRKKQDGSPADELALSVEEIIGRGVCRAVGIPVDEVDTNQEAFPELNQPNGRICSVGPFNAHHGAFNPFAGVTIDQLEKAGKCRYHSEGPTATVHRRLQSSRAHVARASVPAALGLNLTVPASNGTGNATHPPVGPFDFSNEPTKNIVPVVIIIVAIVVAASAFVAVDFRRKWQPGDAQRYGRGARGCFTGMFRAIYRGFLSLFTLAAWVNGWHNVKWFFSANNSLWECSGCCSGGGDDPELGKGGRYVAAPPLHGRANGSSSSSETPSMSSGNGSGALGEAKLPRYPGSTDPPTPVNEIVNVAGPKGNDIAPIAAVAAVAVQSLSGSSSDVATARDPDEGTVDRPRLPSMLDVEWPHGHPRPKSRPADFHLHQHDGAAIVIASNRASFGSNYSGMVAKPVEGQLLDREL